MAKPDKHLRPAFSPFQAEREGAPEVRATISELSRLLAAGRRGGINIPTGHANAVKAAFEAACDPDHPERRWEVTMAAVTPMFATLNFRDPADPAPTTATGVLGTIQQLRAEIEALRAMLAIQIGESPGTPAK